jgi:hypothetical protein
MTTQPAQRPRDARRVAGYVVLGLLAVPVAVAGSLLQGGWFPGGLVLALAGTGGLFYGGGQLTRTRLGSAVPTVVWFLTVMYLSAPRPTGGFLFAAGIGPYVFLLGGMVIGAVCCAVPRHAPPGVPGVRLGV